MDKTQLLYNSDTTNHLKILLKYFAEADEIWLATAFLKMSGLNLLLASIKKHLNTNKSITIVVGQNFGLTEPEALRTVFNLFENKVNGRIYLDNAKDKTSVFHPKLFLIRNNKTGIIISGSANITKGGLTSNQEVSLLCETRTSESNWKQSLQYFQNIASINNANPMSLLLIKRYEDYYKKQLKVRRDQKAAPDKRDSEYSFDYKKLKKRLKKYRTAQSKADFKQREKDYREAKLLLNEIADSERLTQNRFEGIIDALVGAAGQYALWKSGSLFRNRFKVYECKNEFRELIRFIKNQKNNPTNQVFSGAKELVSRVKGAGINYITEIMMTYQPDRFANLNDNPITVLDKEAGVYYKSNSSSFNGEDYQEYCLLIKEISENLELKNMLEVDSFFNEIYWLLKQENKG